MLSINLVYAYWSKQFNKMFKLVALCTWLLSTPFSLAWAKWIRTCCIIKEAICIYAISGAIGSILLMIVVTIAQACMLNCTAIHFLVPSTSWNIWDFHITCSLLWSRNNWVGHVHLSNTLWEWIFIKCCVENSNCIGYIALTDGWLEKM